MTNSTPPAVILVEETNFLDEKSKKVLFGLLKSPMVKMMLGSAKSKTAGVTVDGLTIDNAGIHFTVNDTKIQKSRRVVITAEDLEQIIRFVME